MGRAQGHKTRDRNKSSLPQVPKELKMDRMSEEYAEELNNQLSREEQARPMQPINEIKETKQNILGSFLKFYCF